MASLWDAYLHDLSQQPHPPEDSQLYSHYLSPLVGPPFYSYPSASSPQQNPCLKMDTPWEVYPHGLSQQPHPPADPRLYSHCLSPRISSPPYSHPFASSSQQNPCPKMDSPWNVYPHGLSQKPHPLADPRLYSHCLPPRIGSPPYSHPSASSSQQNPSSSDVELVTLAIDVTAPTLKWLGIILQRVLKRHTFSQEIRWNGEFERIESLLEVYSDIPLPFIFTMSRSHTLEDIKVQTKVLEDGSNRFAVGINLAPLDLMERRPDIVGEKLKGGIEKMLRLHDVENLT